MDPVVILFSKKNDAFADELYMNVQFPVLCLVAPLYRDVFSCALGVANIPTRQFGDREVKIACNPSFLVVLFCPDTSL